MFKKLNKKYLILILGLFTTISLFLAFQVQNSTATHFRCGLIGYWRFESNYGRVAYDSSGNNYDAYANIKNVLWGIKGRVNETTIFYGDRYFTAGDIDDFDFNQSDSFTLTAWVKLDENIKNYRAILGKADSSSKNGYALRHIENGHLGLLLESTDSNKEINLIADKDYRDKQWHHLAGIVNRNNQTAYLYVDGILQDKARIHELGTLVNDNHFNIGGLNNNSVFFEGLLDEVRIYDRALPELEVRDIFLEENAEFVYNLYPAGTLLRASNSYKVYYINHDLEAKWIINQEVFNLYHNDWKDVIVVSPSVLDYYPTVYLIRANGDKKVYYIEGKTKQWIKTPEEFIQRGFAWDEVDPVLFGEISQYQDVK